MVINDGMNFNLFCCICFSRSDVPNSQLLQTMILSYTGRDGFAIVLQLQIDIRP